MDRETFEQAQKARGSRRHFGQRKTNRHYLISPRKGRCAGCGLGFRLQSRSYRVKKKGRDGEVKSYERKALAPVLICRGMYTYPHIYRCRELPYINFDHVQTAIVRRLSEALATDDFALACALPDNGEVEKIEARLKDARDALEKTINELSFVVTEGRTGRIPKEVFDMQMEQLNRLMEYRQAQLEELEIEYQNASDKVKKFEKVMPIVSLLKGFWDTFKQVTVSSKVNNLDGLAEVPVDNDTIKQLRSLLDILV